MILLFSIDIPSQVKGGGDLIEYRLLARQFRTNFPKKIFVCQFESNSGQTIGFISILVKEQFDWFWPVLFYSLLK